jgi:hypothetical protein
LSPYIPTLKKLVLTDARNRTTSVQAYRQNLLIYLDTDSFSFTQDNSSLYTFEYILSSAPTGVSIVDFYHTSFTDYTYRYLAISESAPDGSSCTVQVKAYATAHPEAPIYSNIMAVSIYNPAGTYVEANMPGLLSVDLQIDGKSQFLPVGAGTHTLSLKTNPENYLEATGSTVTFENSMGGGDIPTVSGSTLTITTKGAEIWEGTAFYIKFSLYCPLSEGTHCEWPYFCVTNNKQNDPTAYIDYNFDLYYGIYRGAKFKAGTYLLKPTYRSYTHPDYSKYTVKITIPNMSLPSAITFSGTKFSEGISMTIPTGLGNSGCIITATAFYYNSVNQSNDVRQSGQFILNYDS